MAASPGPGHGSGGRAATAAPPLPPRSQSTTAGAPLPAPAPARAGSPIAVSQTGNYSLYSSLLPSSSDPRRSSTQSLPPLEPHATAKRTLLLIYIHGFMGAETSFRSFPAHVHNLVSITLADSHVVHTKIYPRYRSRRTIDQVAEDFSRWLTPHEGPDTDVILLSHSMGGLVAAEIELLPAANPTPGHTFRHHIIGNVNFDVPFLGMHPGVVSAGIGSIFHPTPQPTEALYDSGSNLVPSTSTVTIDTESSVDSVRPTRHDTLFSQPVDPNFNPKFANDIILPVRKGWENAMHFLNKHSDNLRMATKQLVKSHVEFGRAMADYPGLRLRYMKIRALEDEDTTIRKRLAQQPDVPARVRFVNYYTACTGRSKTRSSSRSRYAQNQDPAGSLRSNSHDRNPSLLSVSTQSIAPSALASIEGHPSGLATFDTSTVPTSDVTTADKESANGLNLETGIKHTANIDSPVSNFQIQMPNFPPLPPAPAAPTPLDLTPFPDEEVRKLIKQEFSRQLRAYKQALSDRETAIRDRQELQDRLRSLNVAEAQMKDQEADVSSRDIKEEGTETDLTTKRGVSQRDVALTPTLGTSEECTPELQTSEVLSTTPAGSTLGSTIERETSHTTMTDREDTRSLTREGVPKPKKDRKFCVLPQKIDGQLDPLWIRVFMEGQDEVSAHTGLFYMSETYERLVGDVGAKIEEWVRDEMTRRMIDDYNS